MRPNQTSYVLLGTLSFGPRTGYSIKTLLDQSIRFFWATSYSQIYPELKRLAERGLVEGRDTTEGGRKRVEYRITQTGQEELRAWLRQPPEIFEMRDEGLLKLFFSNAADRQDALRTLAAIRQRRQEMESHLRELKEGASDLQDGNPYPDIVRRAGVEYARLFACWCSNTERELEAMIDGDRRSPLQPTDGEGTTPQTTDPTERTPDV